MNNNIFFPWFLGFCDAEGNFQITKVKRINKNGILTSIGLKYSFHIGLHERDKFLLEFIKTKLDNRGKIFYYKDKKEVHLAIVKIEDLKFLIENKKVNTYTSIIRLKKAYGLSMHHKT